MANRYKRYLQEKAAAEGRSIEQEEQPVRESGQKSGEKPAEREGEAAQAGKRMEEEKKR